MAPALGRQQESELTQGFVVATPVPAHLHRQVQVDLDPEESLEIPARRRPDSLEHRPALTDEDTLLRVLLDEDPRSDIEAFGVRALSDLVHAHCTCVRYLLVRQVKDLLANNLG